MRQIVQTSETLLPLIKTPLPGPRAQQILKLDARYISPSYTRSYPLVAQSGRGAIVEDVDGNQFLDFNAGIAVVSTGHCHPQVVEAIQRQAGELIHMSGTDFYYPQMVEFAQKLESLTPGPSPKRFYYGNSGTEAVEAAMKLARYSQGRDKFIAFFGAFHGRTVGALSLTASKSVQKKGFGPLLPGVFHVPYPNCYRCAYNLDPKSCSVECAKVIEERLFKSVLPAEETAAIFIEPIQGEGGYVVPRTEFFDELQAIARRHGILIVADEVQSGCGRTGRMWASQHFGLEPQIMTVAKGIASGLPLGVTVADAELMCWKPGAHASTFGGNPLSLAAGLVTLELLESHLIRNAEEMGAYIMDRIADWPERFPLVGEVRGKGLMVGIELVLDKHTKQPAHDLRDRVVEMAFERGLLLLGAGESTIRLSPPLIINRTQADYAMDVLGECLVKVQ
jgi:4-aminobutyrate aminotransferase